MYVHELMKGKIVINFYVLSPYHGIPAIKEYNKCKRMHLYTDNLNNDVNFIVKLFKYIS